MRTSFVIAALIVSLLSAACCRAQSADGIDVPEGMELIKVGGTNVLIPKGTKVTHKDAALILEPLDEYASRVLLKLEEEIAALKEQIAGMQEQIAQLQASLPPVEEPSS